MTGCRHGAKNTLVKNYLHLAEQLGVEVRPRTTVSGLREVPGGWQVVTERSGAWLPRRGRGTVTATQVVLAAGTWGTQRLLHRMRDTGRLPHLSPRLGELTRTNSESLVGALSRRRDVDFTRGVAITSSFRPAPDTHVEPVRYGHGSNAMGLLSVTLTEGDGPRPRWLTWLRDQLRDPRAFLRSLTVRRWSERTIIALVMQSIDNSLVVSGRRRLGRWGLTSRPGHGVPNPTWIPAGNEVVRRLAEVIDGDPGGNAADLIGSTLTAHFLGGAPDRRRPRARRRRRLAPGVRSPWSARRRRCRRVGQPGRQPVPDHHGAGRAGPVVLAGARRGRPAPAAGFAVPAGSGRPGVEPRRTGHDSCMSLFPGWTAADIPDLTGRRAVVTGASSGLGLETARVLAAHGAHVVMTSRDPVRAEQAVRRVLTGVEDASVRPAGLDLADLASVRALRRSWWTSRWTCWSTTRE